MSNVIITTTLQIQKEDLHIFRALYKMKMESCHLPLYCQLVLYCVIAHVISVFSAFLLTIGFQGTSSYLATFQIKTCSSICLKAPIFFYVVHFGMEDNYIYIFNEETDSISQKSGPFQKPAWKFYSFYICFVIFCSF